MSATLERKPKQENKEVIRNEEPAHQPPPVQIAAKPLDLPGQRTLLGPQRGLPGIPRPHSASEAHQYRRDWSPPDLIEGEFVFYRKHNGAEEYPAWVLKSVNKTFTVHVSFPNQVCRDVNSVAYYDHYEPSTGDPLAPFCNYGTCRRTAWGKQMKKLAALIDKVE